ncbi:hypothetical protein BDV97DRAFT_83714 [Delphinella strobiligena]|nr:hypothetical protein BDV97DRAFT_83714 [Delphinella strobiligena]
MISDLTDVSYERPLGTALLLLMFFTELHPACGFMDYPQCFFRWLWISITSRFTTVGLYRLERLPRTSFCYELVYGRDEGRCIGSRMGVASRVVARISAWLQAQQGEVAYVFASRN